MEYILPMVAIEAFGDYQLSQYALNNSKEGLFLGYGAYMGILVFFIQSIKKMGLAWTNTAWDGWSNIATGAVAIFILKEKPTMKELLGIILISLGLLLLGLEGTRKR